MDKPTGRGLLGKVCACVMADPLVDGYEPAFI